MLEQLKHDVCAATVALAKLEGELLLLGSAAAIDRETDCIVVRPSGIVPAELTPERMLVVQADGKVLEGEGRPAGDFSAHRELFRAFRWIGASVHSHSHYAVCFAQAERSIPAYGTTHGDFFCGEIPCTRALTQREISSHYERHMGQVIDESFRYLNEKELPGTLVARHGAFAWGETVEVAFRHAAGLEMAAHLAFDTEILDVNVSPVSTAVLEKQFYRRHTLLSTRN